jgi:hypothetical protein
MLEQPPSYVAGRNPDDRIFTRVISRHPMEKLNADGSFLQLMNRALQSLFNNVAEKLLAPVASTESNSLRDLIEVHPERLDQLWIVEDPVELAGAGKIVNSRRHG